MGGGIRKSFFAEARACLAPMAGYSDAPLRLLCAEYGADFAFTGLVSADGLSRGMKKSAALLDRLEGESPLGVQLFGSNPEAIARAAAVAGGSGASFVDLNFGCPVKKVVTKNGGAAIMRDLALMERIARAAVADAGVPVTAKIRSGWSAGERNYLEAGRLLEECGIAAITLHPRPRSQGFSGPAHWEDIARLRESLAVPVIANGDVASAEDYREIVRVTGCAIVMVGRGAIGNPFIFREIREAAAGGEPRRASGGERLDALERHVKLQVAHFGEPVGIREMRKFHRAYLKSFEGVKKHRGELNGAETLAEVLEIIAGIREELEENGRVAPQEAP